MPDANCRQQMKSNRQHSRSVSAQTGRIRPIMKVRFGSTIGDAAQPMPRQHNSKVKVRNHAIHNSVRDSRDRRVLSWARYSPRDLSMSQLRASLIRAFRISDPRSDSVLLRALESGNSDALTSLMNRHGPMVLRVCRTVLGDEHGAEDAFQAVFLLLSRQAGKLRRPDRLASWLFGAARNIALRARRAASRRRRHEAQSKPATVRDPGVDLTARELFAALDEELERLPELQRLPLLLCYWQGLTNDQAARRLGWTAGSLRGHLERGRKTLANRLTRRGLAPAALLASPIALIAVPRDLLASAAALTAANAVVPATVLALTASSGAAKLLSAASVAAIALGISLIGIAVGFAGPQHPANPTKSAAKAAPLPEGTEESRLDRFGDPLPEGAVARLGSTRLFHGDYPLKLTYSPDGKVVVSTSYGNNRYWQMSDGAEITVPESSRKGLVFRSGDQLIAAHHEDKGLQFRKALTGEIVHDARGIRARLTALGMSREGSDFVVAQHEPELGGTLRFGRFGDAALSDPIALGGKRWAEQIVFAADAGVAAARCNDKSIVVLDISSRSMITSFAGSDGFKISSIALSPDGSCLASAGKEVDLFDARTARKLHSFAGEKPPESVEFSSDGSRLAAAYAVPKVRIWDWAARKEQGSVSGNAFVWHAVFSPDGKTLALADHKFVTLRDSVTGEKRHPFGHGYTIWSFAFSPDGKSLVSGASYTDRIALVWDPTNGARKAEWIGHADGIESVAFSPNGRMAATGSQDGTIRLWDPSTNKEIGRLDGAYGMVYGVAISPDGKTLASTHLTDGPRLWDIAARRELRSFDKLPKGTLRLAFTSDGRELLSYDRDSAHAIATDVATGSVIRRYEGATRPISSMAVSRDGRFIATGSYDGILRLFNLQSGESLGVTGPILGGRPEPEWLYGLAFSPDCRSIAAAYSDKTIRVWETASLSLRAKFEGHADHGLHVAFSPDGSRLASSSIDNTILVWDFGSVSSASSDRLISTKELDSLKADLEGDGASAYRAICRLAAHPQQTLPFLKTLLREPPAASQDRLSKLITDLDDNRPAVRAKAAAELESLGERAVSAMRSARKQSQSPEVKATLDRLLSRFDGPAADPKTMRALRCVEILQRIAAPESRNQLRELASRDPTSRVCVEAKAALKLLDTRPDEK